MNADNLDRSSDVVAQDLRVLLNPTYLMRLDAVLEMELGAMAGEHFRGLCFDATAVLGKNKC